MQVRHFLFGFILLFVCAGVWGSPNLRRGEDCHSRRVRDWLWPSHEISRFMWICKGWRPKMSGCSSIHSVLIPSRHLVWQTVVLSCIHRNMLMSKLLPHTRVMIYNLLFQFYRNFSTDCSSGEGRLSINRMQPYGH